MIKIKRIYAEVDKADGYRILVDRIWPRGVSKATAAIDLWLKEIAPSSELRKWFSHDPGRWKSFREKYNKELESKSDLLDELRKLEKKHGTVSLLYSAKDEKYNQAVALMSFLTEQP